MDGCENIVPVLQTTKNNGHNVACHLYNPEPPFNANKTSTITLELETETNRENRETIQSTETHPQLQVKNLCVHYPIQKGILKRTVGYVYAVDNVTLDIPHGKNARSRRRIWIWQKPRLEKPSFG